MKIIKLIVLVFLISLLSVSLVSGAGLFGEDSGVTGGGGGFIFTAIEEKPGQGVIDWGVPFRSYTVTTTPKKVFEQLPIKNIGNGTIRGIIFMDSRLQPYLNVKLCGQITGKCSEFFIMNPGEEALLQIEGEFDDSIGEGLAGNIIYVEKQSELTKFETLENYFNQAEFYYLFPVEVTRPPGYNLYNGLAGSLGVSDSMAIFILLSIVILLVSGLGGLI